MVSFALDNSTEFARIANGFPCIDSSVFVKLVVRLRVTVNHSSRVDVQSCSFNHSPIQSSRTFSQVSSDFGATYFYFIWKHLGAHKSDLDPKTLFVVETENIAYSTLKLF